MKRATKFLLPIGILIIGFIAMKMLLNFREDSGHRTQQIRPKIVSSEIVKFESIETKISGFGKIRSTQPVDLISEVSGTLRKGNVNFLPGQSFNKGDLLIMIDDRQTKLTINSKISELLTALGQFLPEIKSEFPDESKLWNKYFKNCNFDQQLKSLPEVSSNKVKLYLARFNIYKLYFSIKELEIKLEKYYLYAPFNGTIVATSKRVATNTGVNSLLGKIINLEDFEVEISIPAEDVQWIDYNRPVNFTSNESAGKWEGTIRRIGSSIDERTQTIPVYVGIENDLQSSLINGLFLEGKIPGVHIENAYSVPRRAIYDKSFVYIIVDGKLEYKKVNILREEDKSVIVTNGLSDGDTLVVEILQGVAPGMPAKPVMETSLERGI